MIIIAIRKMQRELNAKQNLHMKKQQKIYFKKNYIYLCGIEVKLSYTFLGQIIVVNNDK